MGLGEHWLWDGLGDGMGAKPSIGSRQCLVGNDCRAPTPTPLQKVPQSEQNASGQQSPLQHQPSPVHLQRSQVQEYGFQLSAVHVSEPPANEVISKIKEILSPLPPPQHLLRTRPRKARMVPTWVLQQRDDEVTTSSHG